MACYSPLTAYRTDSNGKLVFTPGQDCIESLHVPCGQCIGCRLENSRQKAMRGTLEASMHQQNSWLTLTYAPDQEPPGGTLVKRDLQLFIKRLRKKYGEGISHMSCGEYGDLTERMHYHSCLFGLDFEDKYPWKKTKDGILYRSDSLEKIWTKGHALIGEINFETIAYTARYVTKKYLGDDAEKHYGERTPEFVSMSKNPAIGLRFIREYFGDIYPKDFITIRGIKMKPPIYFDRYLERTNPSMYEEVKARRVASAKKLNQDRQKLGRLEQIAEYHTRRLRKKNDTSNVHRI